MEEGEREGLEEVLASDVFAKMYGEAARVVESYRGLLGRASRLVAEIAERAAGDRRPAPQVGYGRVAAVDSSFSDTLLSLHGAALGVIIYGYWLYPEGGPRIGVRVRPAEEMAEEEEALGRQVSRWAKLVELEAMERAVGEDVELVVRDGDFPPAEVFFHPPGGGWSRAVLGRSRRVVEQASLKGVAVAGLVKRIRTSLIAYRYLGPGVFEEARNLGRGGFRALIGLLGDAVVGEAVLRPGDMLVVGRYGDEVWGSWMASGYVGARVGEEKYARAAARVLEENPFLRNVAVAYYRPPFPRSPVVKLTVALGDVERVVGWALSSTPRHPPYPDALNLVDAACLEYARSFRVNDLLLLAVQKAAADLLGDSDVGGVPASTVFAPSNLQKVELILSRLGRLLGPEG